MLLTKNDILSQPNEVYRSFHLTEKNIWNGAISTQYIYIYLYIAFKIKPVK